VKVAGWKRIAVPISVDKVGVFFRELEPSYDDELDTRVQVNVKLKCVYVCACVRVCVCVCVCVCVLWGNTVKWFRIPAKFPSSMFLV